MSDLAHQFGPAWPQTGEAPTSSASDGQRRPLFLTSFAEMVRRNPQAVAIADGPRALTYQELDLRAARWAQRLRDWGITRGSSVAVSIPASVDAVVAVLAVFRAGAVYVPLDSSRPAASVDEALDVMRPRLVLTGRGLPPSAPEGAAPFPTVGLTNVQPQGEAPAAPDASPVGSDVAYAFCIPGPGGGRRRISVTHAVLAGRLAAARAAYGFQPHHVLCCQPSTASETALLEILAALTAGASLRLGEGREGSRAVAGAVIRALARTSGLARPLRRTTTMVRRSDTPPAGRPQHRPSVTVPLHGDQRSEPSHRRPPVRAAREGTSREASLGAPAPSLSGVAKLLLRVLGRSDQSVPRREVSA